jgi:hypothetical protein
LACDTRLLGVQVFSPYRANFKPPLEVVVMTYIVVGNGAIEKAGFIRFSVAPFLSGFP